MVREGKRKGQRKERKEMRDEKARREEGRDGEGMAATEKLKGMKGRERQ